MVGLKKKKKTVEDKMFKTNKPDSGTRRGMAGLEREQQGDKARAALSAFYSVI